MAEAEQHAQGGDQTHLSRTNLLCASLAGVLVGGPLVGMMGLTLLASTTLLLVASPLLLLSSPLLLLAGLVLAAHMAGFGTAAAMGLAGVSAISWVCRSVGGKRPVGIGETTEKLEESGERVKEEGLEFGGYLMGKGHEQQPEQRNRG